MSNGQKVDVYSNQGFDTVDISRHFWVKWLNVSLNFTPTTFFKCLVLLKEKPFFKTHKAIFPFETSSLKMDSDNATLVIMLHGKIESR